MVNAFQQRKLFMTALIASAIMHGALFIVLFIKLPSNALPVAKRQHQIEPVKALAVNQQDVQKEIARIEHDKQLAEQRRQDELNRYRHAVEQAKKHERNVKKKVAELSAKQKHINDSIKKAQVLAKKREHDALLKKQELAKLAKKQAALKKKVAMQKAQELARKKALEDKKKAQELKRKNELARLAKERAKALHDAMQKQLSKEQSVLAKQHAAQMTKEIAQYKTKIVSAVSRSWLVPKGVNKKLSCQLLIHLGPGGVVLDVSTLKSSGDAVLDRSAKTAVLKASPLPVPAKKELFDQFRELRLTVRPEGIRAT